MVGVKYIASVSFGKDSLAMLLRLLKERYPLDFVVFYNTGMEFACIYKIRDAVIQLLNERGIRFVLTWRNACDQPNHYYAPFPGQESADDFKAFSELDEIVFCK